MKSKNKTKVLVFIPTFNAVEDVQKLVDDILNQSGDFDTSILITDSSTILESQERLSKIKDVTFRTIPSKEFSHGGTRAKAIDFAIKNNFEFIVFTVQDAQMVDSKWLKNMIEPFSLNKKVACVYGKQVPYKEHNAYSKVLMNKAFLDMSPNEELVLHTKQNKEVPGTYFNSHVNSAYRLEFFKKGMIKMPNINYAEDQHMAEQIINKGLVKVYNPRAIVYHSHSWGSVYEYFQRYYDEYRGLYESIGYESKMGRKKILAASWNSAKVISKLVLKTDDNIISRIKWAFLTLPLELNKHIAMYLSPRDSEVPEEVRNLLSREDMMKHLRKSKLGIMEQLKALIFITKVLLKGI